VDAGHARPGLLAALAAVVLLLLTAAAGPAQGRTAESLDGPTAGQRRVVLNAAYLCEGYLSVAYDLQTRTTAGPWVAFPDDGSVTKLQLQFVAGREGPTGRGWHDVEVGLKSEGWMHARPTGLPYWDDVRVIDTEGRQSNSLTAWDGCPA
jgi:hypothetical protein